MTDTDDTQPQAASARRADAIHDSIQAMLDELLGERAAHEEHRRGMALLLDLPADADWLAVTRRLTQTVRDMESVRRRNARYGARVLELGAQVDELTARLGEYADRGIANGQRAETAEAEVKRLGRMVSEYGQGASDLSRKLRAAKQTLAAVRAIGRRLAAHAQGFQDALDETDRDPWASTVRADLAELHTALGDDQPAEAQSEPHSCGNCEGIDPGTCMANPDRAAAVVPEQPADLAAAPHIVFAISSHLAAGAKLADALRNVLGEQL